MRDGATIGQLVVLSNLESINAVLIHEGLAMPERLRQLNAIAISQMRSLIRAASVKRLGNMQGQKAEKTLTNAKRPVEDEEE
jgi:hypothetical protein